MALIFCLSPISRTLYWTGAFEAPPVVLDHKRGRLSQEWDVVEMGPLVPRFSVFDDPRSFVPRLSRKNFEHFATLDPLKNLDFISDGPNVVTFFYGYDFERKRYCHYFGRDFGLAVPRQVQVVVRAEIKDWSRADASLREIVHFEDNGSAPLGDR